MVRYKVELTRSAEKALFKLSKPMIKKIVPILASLAINPYPVGCRKLSGQKGTFRIRVHVYRILYEIFDDLVLVKVLKIGHRKDVYR